CKGRTDVSMATVEAVRSGTVRVSVVIPCLNEAENIEECVLRARAVLDERRLNGEVIVVDNASEDESAELARAAGATVVEEPHRRSLRYAGPAAGRPAVTRSSGRGNGVCVRDGDPRDESAARHPGVPDRAPSPRRRIQALASPRRLAPSAAHPPLQPELPLP